MSPKFVDDDLTEAIPVKTPDPVTTRPAAVAAATTTPATVVADDDVDLLADYDFLKPKPSLPNVLPKESGKTNRFCLIKSKAFVRETHYLTGGGAGKGTTVICVGSGCPECAKGGEHSSRRKIGSLAVLYETDNSGKFGQGTTKPNISVGYISMSPTAYGEMVGACSEDDGQETIYTIDFKATKKSTGIGWNFSRAGFPTAVSKAKLEAEVAALAAPYADGVVLKSRLGKVVTVTEMKALLSGGSGVVDTAASLADLEGLD